MRKLNNPPSGPARVRKVAFYVRVSTENQARVAEGSLKNQEQMLSAELRRRNSGDRWGRHVGSYVDGGFSGKNTERPEFKRLMADVERGAVDAIFFTELSRLSRSLRDFLNIFEYTQEHNCDLICLKTEIDTTSPYSNMVTKMLMVFAEFEREVTAERISRNAYERSRRGLAYGGFELLGYKRDPEHRGRLIIDPDETKIVRDIFTTYIRRRSLLGAVEILKKKYDHPRIQKLSRNGIYGILTNKVYIGIREIKIADGIEEVPGAWKPIVDKQIFSNVSSILKTNGPGPRSFRFNYLLSGLIRCAKCGKKLQGKSGTGRSGKIRYYYAHGPRCSEGGLHSIEANDAHKLIEEWLGVLTSDADRLGELVEKGLKRIRGRLNELNRNLKKLDYEDAALRKKLADSSARTLAGNISATTELLEKEAEQLLSQIQKNERETESLKNETESLNAILSTTEKSFFHKYSEQARRFLGLSPREKRSDVRKFFRTLTMGDYGLHVELQHPNGQSFTNSVTILRDVIPLPGVLLVKNRALLRRLYKDDKLSAREISRRLNAASSTVWDHLHRFGLIAEAKEQKKGLRHIPFGYDSNRGILVPNRKEQEAIRTVRQLRAAGLTLRDIAAHLNRKLVATKRGGVWDPNTVRKILHRPSKEKKKAPQRSL